MIGSEQKKSIGVTIIIILVVLFGIGLFLFLRYAKENVNFKLDNKTIKLNSTLSNDINDYMEKNNKNCKLDISEVNTKKVGKYKYYVKCKKKTYEATIEVK